MSSDPVEVLRRWAESGGVWRVLGRAGDTVTVGLFECTGGQEVDRFTSAESALRRFLGERTSSEG
ncbi:hypothetical protein [Nocardia rhizosphaerae]|uniref:Uncharacterized protein n=1 Tax=Nocardia rhizosphaerae TaxID=1691571 RepID=A0ABV8LA33_9NOCA